MNNFRSNIFMLQINNFEFRYFVSYNFLCILLSRDLMKQVIDFCDFSIFRKSEIVEIVMRKTKRILAILIFLREKNTFFRFIATDHFRVIDLNFKLSLSLIDFSKILKITTIAKEFYDVQWTFVFSEFTYNARIKF